MAYATGTIASTTDAIHDLMAALVTFVSGLSTKPWTVDEHNTTNRYATFHRAAEGSDRRACYVSFRWDNSTKFRLALYQSTAFSGPSVAPHLHTGDSGNGSTTSPATSGRRVNFDVQGPFTAYHFFAGEGATPYVYVVVEVSANVFRHFGWGNLDKFNDWTGGEFVYGGFWDIGLTANIDNPAAGTHGLLLDCGATVNEGATVRVEGLPGQGGTGKWGVCTSSASPGNDTAAIARVGLRGCSRSGGWGYPLAWIPTSQANAFKPLIPINLFYFRETGAPDTWYPLGRMADVAIVNMKNLTVGQELTVGSDTWKCFPWAKKQYSAGNVIESWNAGYAYKKVT